MDALVFISTIYIILSPLAAHAIFKYVWESREEEVEKEVKRRINRAFLLGYRTRMKHEEEKRKASQK